MSNNIEITVGATETASHEIGKVGDASKDVAKVVVQSMGTTEAAFDTAARGSGKFGDALDKAEGATGKLGDGVSGVSDVIDSFNSISNHAADRQRELARAQQDVEQAANDAKQAVEDQNQAQRDLAQSGIDAKQAQIDEAQAIKDQSDARTAYAEALAKGKKGAGDAKQALIDLSQAELDQKQAQEDGLQAERDASQAHIDGTQSLIDQKGAATDLSEAQSNLASSSSTLGKVSDYANLFGSALSGVSAVIGLVTVAQWAWNSSLLASPVTWIVLAIAAVVAVIVLLATKTQFFQTIWDAVWGFMKAVGAWFAGPFVNFFKNAWKSITSFFTNAKDMWVLGFQIVINKATSLVNYFLAMPGKLAGKLGNMFAPIWNGFKAMINLVIRGWNSLQFSIPGFSFAGFTVRGFTLGVPNLPYLAKGGDVLKSGLAYIHAGERITDRASTQQYDRTQGVAMNSHAEPLEINLTLSWDDARVGDKIMDAVSEGIRYEVKTTGGGNVQVAYGRGTAS